MNMNTPRNQVFQGEVTDVRMTMGVTLEDGRRVYLSGNLPKGSMIDIHGTDIHSGKVMGYDGYEVSYRAPRIRAAVTLSQRADAASNQRLPLTAWGYEEDHDLHTPFIEVLVNAG